LSLDSKKSPGFLRGRGSIVGQRETLAVSGLTISSNPQRCIRFRARTELPISAPPMKWAHHPNLRKRPRTPAKGRGSVQRAIRRAFAASGTEALTSSAIYDWAHIRRRLGRRKSMPFGVYSRTLRTLRAMCDPIERVPPHGAWLWRLRNTADD